MDLALSELAARLGLPLEGDGAVIIRGVAGVRDAGPDELAYVALAKYAPLAGSTRAAALIVPTDWNRPVPCPVLRAEKPEAAFTRAAQLFAAPAPAYPTGVHPTAVVSPEAKLGRDVHVGPLVVIEPGAAVGDRTILMAGVYVGHGAEIGEDGRLYPGVTLREHVRIGKRVILHNGVVIGGDGFGYDVDRGGVRHKIPQIGIVVLGDDVEIGANTTVDRARFGKTRIGNGVKIDNLVQIAHNVVIGDHAVIVSQAGIAGSTIIGAKAVLAGQAGVAGHLVIGEGAIIGAQAGVTKDVPPGAYVIGFPATPQKEMAEQFANVSRLPSLKARVAELEMRLQALETRLPRA